MLSVNNIIFFCHFLPAQRRATPWAPFEDGVKHVPLFLSLFFSDRLLQMEPLQTLAF